MVEVIELAKTPSAKQNKSGWLLYENDCSTHPLAFSRVRWDNFSALYYDLES
jgi:hypothetical protein